MRHLKRTAKLGRQFEHRNAMLSNMVCSLIKHKRITTTLAKAKAARSVAEKQKWRAEEDVIRILFEDIAPAFKGRVGGYTRIIKLEQRPGDSAPKAILEWVDEVVSAAPVPEAKADDKKAKEAAAAK